jgi:hypothetical protein
LSRAFGGTSYGLYVGWSAPTVEDINTQRRAVVWRPGARRPAPIDVAEPSRLSRVNEAGLATGLAAVTPLGVGRPFVWERGRVRYLRSPSGLAFTASVSEGGDVVGSIVAADGHEKPAIWHRHRNGWRLQRLQLPSGVSDAFAVDVTEDGSAVGVSYGDVNFAYRWTPRGRARMLRTRPRHDAAAAEWVSADGSRIAGAVFRENRPSPAVWRWGRSLALPPDFGGGGLLYTGDGTGWYGGESSFTASESVSHPLVYREGANAARLLPSINRDRQGAGTVFYIAPGGRVAAGSSQAADSAIHATVWTCGVRQSRAAVPTSRVDTDRTRKPEPASLLRGR